MTTEDPNELEAGAAALDRRTQSDIEAAKVSANANDQSLAESRRFTADVAEELRRRNVPTGVRCRRSITQTSLRSHWWTGHPVLRREILEDEPLYDAWKLQFGPNDTIVVTTTGIAVQSFSEELAASSHFRSTGRQREVSLVSLPGDDVFPPVAFSRQPAHDSTRGPRWVRLRKDWREVAVPEVVHYWGEGRDAPGWTVPRGEVVAQVLRNMDSG